MLLVSKCVPDEKMYSQCTPNDNALFMRECSFEELMLSPECTTKHQKELSGNIKCCHNSESTARNQKSLSGIRKGWVLGERVGVVQECVIVVP